LREWERYNERETKEREKDRERERKIGKTDKERKGL
jgi:hypothetical protein